MAHLKPTYAHLVRFGECLRLCKDKMNDKNIYFTNPVFDKGAAPKAAMSKPAE